MASRAKAKLGRGIERARAAGERAVGAVKSSSDATQAKAREAGSSAKAGAKGLVGRAARAVSRGARGVARRLGEDVDLYDIVLEHLLDEGFADTEESATVIMANMSEEWREEILDEEDKELLAASKECIGRLNAAKIYKIGRRSIMKTYGLYRTK